MTDNNDLIERLRKATQPGDYLTSCVPNRLLLEAADALEAARAEVSGLRAARIAYANEFPLTEDGEPDTGNVHANIRALKARAERLAEALRGWIWARENGASEGLAVQYARAVLEQESNDA